MKLYIDNRQKAKNEYKFFKNKDKQQNKFLPIEYNESNPYDNIDVPTTGTSPATNSTAGLKQLKHKSTNFQNSDSAKNLLVPLTERNEKIRVPRLDPHQMSSRTLKEL